jgi:hypothetical protein
MDIDVEVYICEHFQNTRKSLVLRSASECDDKINDVCAKFEYPITEVRTTGFTGHLNHSRQSVRMCLLQGKRSFFSFGATAPICALAYLHDTLRVTSVY